MHHLAFPRGAGASKPVQGFTNILPKGIIHESARAAFALPGVFVRPLVQ
jgi:hypothetical protein